MKFVTFEHNGVEENGKCDTGGAVHVNGVVTMSEIDGGCDLEHCNCSEGHWICVTAPREIGTRTVRGRCRK